MYICTRVCVYVYVCGVFVCLCMYIYSHIYMGGLCVYVYVYMCVDVCCKRSNRSLPDAWLA